ncbi:putative orfan [Tupanvirus soda lake]|uniref:Orfan n=2 Tax=Tupanvirus TaxID=2094720 RepID=A0AC62AC79_9VIRU|nr:putative orfan [Tupanvirus soda lake]QKU35391.1 putative orfan [Tupanvirus soda lake]
MDLYNAENKNNKFYSIVKTIVNDKDTRKIIYKMSDNQIYDVICFLNNKMCLQLIDLIEKILKTIPKYKLNSNTICNKMIDYHNYCTEKNIKFTDVLATCKLLLMKAGASKTISSHNKNIIMQGITVTLRSVLERNINKDRIDDNLRQGAFERKEHLQKGHHKKRKVYKPHEPEPIFDEYTPVKLSNKKHITTEVSTNPNSQEKHKLHTHSNTIQLSSQTTVKDYKEGVEALKSITPTNVLDIPLSPALDVPPVGNSGATLVTTADESVLTTSNKNNTETNSDTHNTEEKKINITSTKEAENDNPSSIETKSVLVGIVQIPPEKVYNEAPFNVNQKKIN